MNTEINYDGKSFPLLKECDTRIVQARFDAFSLTKGDKSSSKTKVLAQGTVLTGYLECLCDCGYMDVLTKEIISKKIEIDMISKCL